MSTVSRDEQFVRSTFARLDPVAMGVALGVVCAAALCLGTVILLLKGAPPGQEVGPNLANIGHLLIGYEVTWIGSLIGIAYGGLIGGALGVGFAFLWNVAHLLILSVVLLGSDVL